MTVWRFVVPATSMGEKAVPAPHDPSGSGQALIRRTGTWIHENDWPYIQLLKFPCRGIMKDGFMEGCPDAKQMATRPPDPPIAPPLVVFEMPKKEAQGPALDLFEKAEEVKAVEPKHKKGRRL